MKAAVHFDMKITATKKQASYGESKYMALP